MSAEHHVRPKAIQQSPDVLLINVPATFEQGIIPDDEEPPFGLMRLATVSEKSGYQPAILDAHRAKLTPSEIDDVLYGLQPKSVGINPTSVNTDVAREIAEKCAGRDIPLIVGGVQATLDPISALKDFPAYAVVKGPGEIALLTILAGIQQAKRFEAKGIYYPNTPTNGRDDFAEPYPIEQLPLIDQGKWVENPITKRSVRIYGKTVELREISFYETAGCPFDCTFCATPALVGRGKGHKPYHHPGMEKIIADIQLAINLGANAVHFVDDMTIISPQQLHQFASGLEQLGLSSEFYWRGMTRASIIADKFSDEDLKILVQSGCWRITMGVESGDEQILKRINKRITPEQVIAAVQKLINAGIPQIKAFFIMGFPGETLKQMQRTRDLIMKLKRLGLTHISLFQFKPYPGTAEWRHLEQTNPEVLSRLSYIRKNYYSDDKNNYDVPTKKISEGVWLPDDVQIAAVPSGTVREMVINTLNEFYDS